ncbi:uncharacterized protein LOC100121952 [Nasonia vitripennis]|uniref:CHK kinase-like domain-containing protein n=1 Tax=Nasonia vitripennis TaxID=7425 RepID=A0A7M7G646_NASVI|nr:uncharacterized protein LOC100121952 [Nasonia vitripennis]
MRPTPEEDLIFIKDKLLPAMIKAGRFNESLRSVTFDHYSAIARPYPYQLRDYHLNFALYRAEINFNHSNASTCTVNVWVKLLPNDCTKPTLTQALNGFHNEEYFWRRVSPLVGRELLPRFYAAEMQKYGRPVVVVEDLEMSGFRRSLDPRQLSAEEAILVLKCIGRMHGKGMALKQNRPHMYAEIRRRFKKVTLHSSDLPRIQRELLIMSNQLSRVSIGGAIVRRLLESDPLSTCREAFESEPVTICNGLTFRGNMWFKYDENDELQAVKLLDWQRACSGSNCFDFAMINEEGDHRSYWRYFREVYYKAVRREYPAATERSLFENYSQAGLCYKLILSTLPTPYISPPDGEMPDDEPSYCTLL